jgi:hypothetical protein
LPDAHAQAFETLVVTLAGLPGTFIEGTQASGARTALTSMYAVAGASSRYNTLGGIRAAVVGREPGDLAASASAFAAKPSRDRLALLADHVRDDSGGTPGPSEVQPVLGDWSPAVLSRIAIGLACAAFPDPQGKDRSDSVITQLYIGQF